MAAKKSGNGHVGGESETIVAAIREELGKLREDINDRLDTINGRLEKIIENTGARWCDHEARLAALGDKLGIKSH